MPASTVTDLKKTVQDLSTSSFPSIRRAAADQLGQLSISTDEIVQALAAAVALDSDADVRSTALRALQAPVHQAFLKDHPDFIREATRAAVQHQAHAKQREEAKIMAEYVRRRSRQRRYHLLILGSLLTSWCMFLVGAAQGWLAQGTVCVWQVGFIGFVIVIVYLSWRNWRCPACEAWLGGFRFHIHALWSAETFCPNCGTRLL